MSSLRLKGLIAATFTPMDANGDVALEPIPGLVDQLANNGVTGLYICGSTGEGVSLSCAEREDVARAYVDAAGDRLATVVQVGHTSIADAKRLAAHAQAIGASAVSAVAPFYFKPATMDLLIDTMADIAGAAPELPFYYYNIPPMTGVDVPMVDFLQRAPERIPTLHGIKFSHQAIHDMQDAIRFDGGKYNILFGVDQMMLSGLCVGVEGAVGSTFNFLAPLFRELFETFAIGKIEEAEALQHKAVELIRIILDYGPMPGQKAVLKLIGHDAGPCRLPLDTLNTKEIETLKVEMDAVGFGDWSNK